MPPRFGSIAPPRQRDRDVRLIGLILIGAGLWILWHYASDRPPAGEYSSKASPTVVRTPELPNAPDADGIKDVLDRPLFYQRRRTPDAAFAAPPPIPQLRVRLSAVSISNSVRVAVIQELDSNRTFHVREGDIFREWTIEKVRRDSVMLSLKDKKITIPLFSGD